jgi:NAD(P)-dependent dehydrogenase (short-subunit alcohol dehydrogenase family)
MTQFLITGANRGLGLEFTRQYLAAGDHVIAACRQASPTLTELGQSAAGRLEIMALDVTDHASIDALAQSLADRQIDVLINNAGIYGPRDQSLDKLDYTAWAQTFAVNTMAPLKLIMALRANLLKSKAPKAITITSRMGSIAETSGGSVIYRSSKAAVNMVIRNLSKDLAGDGIAFAVMHPGWVKTDMGGPQATLTPEISISGMRKVIAALDKAQSGGYFNYDGTLIPW